MPLGRLLLETFLIVVAVLLALAVDEWRASRAEARLVRSVLETMRVELAADLQILDLRLPYHQSMGQSVKTAAESLLSSEATRFELRDPERVPTRADLGIDPGQGLALAPTIADSAWQAALRSGALTSLDYQLLYRISVVYTLVADVEKAEERLLAALDRFDRAYLERRGEVAAFAGFASALEDLILRELELREKGAELLAEIDDR